MSGMRAGGSRTIDVVIPTVGRETLRRAVHSVAQQTVECRIIVVLDRPERLTAVKTMLSEYNCEIIATCGGTGGASARNLGADNSESDFVAFLDDDDWWVRDKLERQLSAAMPGVEFVLSATAMEFHRPSGEVTIPTHPLSKVADAADYLVQRPNLRYGTHAIQTSSLLVSRKVVEEVRWDDSLQKHQDWDYLIRVFELPSLEFHWVNESLVHVVQGTSGSISMKPNWKGSRFFLEKHEARMSERARSDFIFTQILRSSLASRDVDGIKYALAMNKFGIPHIAAAVVGLSGVRGALSS